MSNESHIAKHVVVRELHHHIKIGDNDYDG